MNLPGPFDKGVRLILSSLIDERKRLGPDKAAQISLSIKYQDLVRSGAPLPALQDVEFRAFSQNGEDGILLYIFSLIGTTDRRVVEMCCGTGIECNAANLLINHGWTGMLVDGNSRNAYIARRFYESCRDTSLWPPKILHSWITRGNVNSLLSDNGFSGEIDLFSLDMDGVDYWVWKAIDVIRPRVVVVEFQDIWGPEKTVTVPYRDDFQAEFGKHGPDYSGASLAAFAKLGKEKGYRLIGVEKYGFNAFFLRNDVGIGVFPEVRVDACLSHPKAQFGYSTRLPKVRDLEWVEV